MGVYFYTIIAKVILMSVLQATNIWMEEVLRRV